MFSKYLNLYLSKLPFIIFAFIILHSPYELNAKVTGRCDNCHTMHNSQNGNNYSKGPNQNLLVNVSGLSSDICVGCHSSASGATWKDTVTGAPIVWNQSEPTFNANKGLAGGNFYWVATQGSRYGHNVNGIAGQDDKLTVAPGIHSNVKNTCGTNSCHYSLAENYETENNALGDKKTGCQGCHYYTSHHDDSKNWYRFLKGHGPKDSSNYVPGCEGCEDPDWEFETSNNHNWYKGTADVYSNGALATKQTMSAFCSGCHGAFHGPLIDGEGMGSASPWRRHPTDISLPQGDSSEYSKYNPATNYNALAPVAWMNPSTKTGPVVMCLSCHRSHGTNQPDMLRWNYNNCNAGPPSNSDCGCFVCHTEKDG